MLGLLLALLGLLCYSTVNRKATYIKSYRENYRPPTHTIYFNAPKVHCIVHQLYCGKLSYKQSSSVVLSLVDLNITVKEIEKLYEQLQIYRRPTHLIN